MPTNAEAIAAVLRDAGVQRCFGHPGGEIVVFLEACRRAGIEFLLTGHEASAAFMADVTGQITGVPGLCASTLGPGATNLVTGVSNALLDRSPVLAVTAQLSTQLDPSYSHQRLDLGRLFAPITKWSVTIDGYGTQAIAERAVSLAQARRRGPVHMALPSDLAGQSVRSDEPSESLPDVPAAPGAPPAEALTRAAAAITRAHRPAVVIGVGADPQRTAGPLARFLAASGFPFLTTPKAKGIVDEADPRFIGIISGMAGDEVVLRVMQRCDLLIGVGFDPVECDKDWFVRQRFVALDEVGGAEGGYQPEVEVIGAIPATLDHLASAVSGNHGWEGHEIAAMREEITGFVRPRRPAQGGLSPYEVMLRLRETWPEDGIAVCDVGARKLLIGQVWRGARPGTFFMSNGLSSMGYGLPGAVAAKLVHPDRPVLCVTGDGGFLMVLHVLEFMVREAVPVVGVVLSDRTLAAIKVSQRRR